MRFSLFFVSAVATKEKRLMSKKMDLQLGPMPCGINKDDIENLHFLPLFFPDEIQMLCMSIPHKIKSKNSMLELPFGPWGDEVVLGPV